MSGTLTDNVQLDEILASLARAYPELEIDGSGLSVQDECRAPIPGTELFLDMNKFGAVLMTKYTVSDMESLFAKTDCQRVGDLIDKTADGDLPVPRPQLERFWVLLEGSELTKCQKLYDGWDSDSSSSSSTDKLAIIRMERS